MLVHRRVMSWRRVWKSLQPASAHCLLSSFTLLLAFKLGHVVSHSWWFIFTPLWLFHCVIARGRFSLPASSMYHDQHWTPPLHLLVAFEIFLCVHLEEKYAVSLKIVFLPLLGFEVAILLKALRICRRLMPGGMVIMSGEAIWGTLPHFWISISMVFFIGATTLTVLKLCGDIAGWGWWDLFKYFGIAECLAFLACLKWSNQTTLRYPMVVSYMDWNLGVTDDNEHQQSNRMCSLQDIVGHVMKIPFITFQIILIMRLEGKPAFAKNISILVLFVPLFLLQGVGVLFAIYRLVKESILLINGGDDARLLGWWSVMKNRLLGWWSVMKNRLLGWWSTDEGSQEEQARLISGEATGYNTFSPEVAEKMPKSDLVKEIGRLQKLQKEKSLCIVCFEDVVSVVLLPCRHHVLCSKCCKKCEKCPICRALIKKRMPVYDV